MENVTIDPAPAPANDVWSTLTRGVETIAGAYTTLQTARLKRVAPSSAAPAGAPAQPNPNPFAGFWSAFPQSDTKQQYQNQSPLSFGAINPLWLVLIALVGVLFFVRR